MTQFNRQNASVEDSFDSVDTSARLESIRKSYHRKADETLGTFPSSEIETTQKALVEGILEWFNTTIPGTIYKYSQVFAYEAAYKAFFTSPTQMVEGGFERSTLSFDAARKLIKESLKEIGHDEYVWVIHTEQIYGAGSCLFDQDRVPLVRYTISAKIPVFATGTRTEWEVSDVNASITQDGWSHDRDFHKTSGGIFPPNEDI
tara:strand:- start:331 stop:939 length:609 start_codon:yes stop_codon:yes gene_type:complete